MGNAHYVRWTYALVGVDAPGSLEALAGRGETIARVEAERLLVQIERDALIAQVQQPLLVQLRQGRSADIKTQMNRGRHLVDILPARPLGTDGRPLDLGVRYRNLIEDW